jgi:hypothetical protein
MSDVRHDIERLLGLGLTNDALAETLAPLTSDPDFAAAADLWAPALYARDPRFFAPMLARNLTAEQANVITGLLPRIEADGQAELFAALYPLAVNEATWNADLGAQVAAHAEDADLARAVAWRAGVAPQFALSEDLAVAIYTRVPVAFAAALLAHVLPGYDWQAERARTYAALRQTMQVRHDDAAYWALFRAFATTDEWKVELARLAQQNMPAERIVAELNLRRLDQPMNMDPAALVIFVDRYGATLAPFIDANLDWFGRLQTNMLLDAIERTGDAALFRRVFFRFADVATWNARIRALVAATPDAATLAEALRRWQPPVQQVAQRTWRLEPDLAVALYQRDAARFRDFILATLANPDITLFDEVEDDGDEAMLDALTFAFLDQFATLISTTFPFAKTMTVATLADGPRGWAQNWTQAINDRFERIFALSPATYARHAATILSRDIGAAWKLRDDPEMNPVAYLTHQHREAWLSDGAAMRDLLETPNDQTYLFALELLTKGGKLAAPHVVASLPLFLAFLLSNGSATVKRHTLRLLEAVAAVAAPEDAAQIQAMLGEMLHYHSQQKLDERTMVSFVRARHYAMAQTAS